MALLELVVTRAFVPMMIGAQAGQLTIGWLLHRAEARQHRAYIWTYAALAYGSMAWLWASAIVSVVQIFRH